LENHLGRIYKLPLMDDSTRQPKGEKTAQGERRGICTKCAFQANPGER